MAAKMDFNAVPLVRSLVGSLGVVRAVNAKVDTLLTALKKFDDSNGHLFVWTLNGCVRAIECQP